MKRRPMNRALAMFAAALLATNLFAQAPPAAAKKYPPVPRAADGKPDLTGVWQAGSNRIGTWEETNVGAPGRGEVTPNPVQPTRDPAPYQEWAAKKVLDSFNRRGVDDPMARCLSPGVPRTTTMGLFPMQIVQTPTQIVMLFEVFHVFRVIPIDAKHPDDLESSYMGDSVGHWDGDTLVVDVTGFNDETWLAGTGTFHSDALHVVERFKRADYNTIQYEVTMEDPKVLTKTWVSRSNIMLRPGTRLREYECSQNNTDLKRYEKLLEDESVFRRK
jgi:hypothetical protein